MIVLAVLAMALVACPGGSATIQYTLDRYFGDHFLPNCVNTCQIQFHALEAPYTYMQMRMDITYGDHTLCIGCPGPSHDSFTALFVQDKSSIGTATVWFEADTTHDADAPVVGMTFKLDLVDETTCTTREQKITGVYQNYALPEVCGDLKQTCQGDSVSTALSVQIDTLCSCPDLEEEPLMTVVDGFSFDNCE